MPQLTAHSFNQYLSMLLHTMTQITHKQMYLAIESPEKACVQWLWGHMG